MPKKIISLDELSRFKSKYDAKLNDELALKTDKTGPLPSYTAQLTDNIISFITTNNVDGKAIILSISTIKLIGYFRNISGTTYSFELESLSSSTRYYSSGADLNGVVFAQLIGGLTYRRDFEETANKVTSLSGNSTDAQYPSAKCVYDNLQNVREVAEGKCKAFVLSCDETEPTEENFIANRWKRIDGTPINTWVEFVEWTTTSDNVRMTYANPEFNSSDDDVDIAPSYFITTTYIVVRDKEDLIIGDVILVTQLQVPDRWVAGIGIFSALESTTLDPSGYVDDHTIAPAYSNQLTYAVGDLVIYDHKLYRCTTAVSSAEDFDTNKWVQATVSDTFVDLYRDQTISGVKTIAQNNEIRFASQANAFQAKTNGIDVKIRTHAYAIRENNFLPMLNNDLGSSTLKWKDIYLSGVLSNGTNSVSIDDLVALITYAKGQGWIQ